MDKPLLLKTLAREPTHRPPLWYMRQAGRVLPSYLELKKNYSFWQMMKDPEMAAMVTLLPVRDLEVDAAILFTDILVVPYAMGLGLDFTEGGPVFDQPLAAFENPLKQMRPDPGKLNYIYRVIEKVMETKPDHIPLIGFCGGPLSVLCYMLEGLSRDKDFPETVKFIYRNKRLTGRLISLITEISLEYVKNQVKHGIQVFQLFETHAGLLPFELYRELCFPMVKQLAALLRELNIPFIYFPKDIGLGIREITPDHCDFLSIDWQTSLFQARKMVHAGVGLQGNLDPRALMAGKEEIAQSLDRYHRFGKEYQDWIFNLGHGFKPGIPFENIRFMTEWMKRADWQRD